MAKAVQRVKKKEKKNITAGVAHVNSTFNNTRVTITDAQRVTPYPGRRLALRVSRVPASRLRMPHRLPPKKPAKRLRKTVWKLWKLKLKAPVLVENLRLEPCRLSVFTITSIRDVTPIPHNGCRMRKKTSRLIFLQIVRLHDSLAVFDFCNIAYALK